MQQLQSGSTRETILNMLKSKGSLSVQHIASELGLTGMAIRRHLQELERQHYVTVETVVEGKGRPVHYYTLTVKAEQLFPRNYQMLTLDLLQELSEDDETRPIIEKMFQGRKRKLYERYAQTMAGHALEQRVLALVDIQTAAGYMAELSSDATYYYMAEYNCPIKNVAEHYTQACQCELELFSELLNCNVVRTECMTTGQKRCVYQISK